MGTNSQYYKVSRLINNDTILVFIYRLHRDIANKINEFLQLAPSPFEQEETAEEDNNDKTSKKTD